LPCCFTIKWRTICDCWRRWLWTYHMVLINR
jgi:hypothetical protein